MGEPLAADAPSRDALNHRGDMGVARQRAKSQATIVSTSHAGCS